MSRKQELEERLKDVILGTCNKTGCQGCGLKWDGGCSATELEGQIQGLEMGQNDD